ncbi:MULTISPECIES: hypothetical protein [Agrobacterium]|uniref:hypothetical protein n=1 Tax=Agrobacterium TaxID=357 RepID=UPI001573BF5E|nr:MULTISPECIES: hypothetical protein [Agrobacterium]MBO9108887.1 hypothetical protein [Agrobacterium sp. S2/73]NTA15996.1 hypothetical protein [Agrobacterium tumefaciens]QXZ73362.1 hypothetical protein J5276_05275 [Agrobacterium sp. S7/73]WCK72220.1 hypothetical protein G6L96_007115 [Agrobacterium tumefaciens]
MTTGNTMQIDPLVALQEANAREEFFKQRNLFLAQHLAMQNAENKVLLDKINGLEADLRLARGDGDTIDGETE